MDKIKLKVGEEFFRDDFYIKIVDIKQVIELNGDEVWRVKTQIFVDDALLLDHGFKVAAVPNRTHFSLYANKWVPKTIINYMNGGRSD